VATEAVNGDWTPVIKYAAYLMEVTLTDSSLATIKARIQQESGGSETIVNTTDSNAQAGHPSIGLLQYIQSTFDAWCLEGYTTITKGFHQLLALFNDSNWLADISVSGGWGPTGTKRFTKLPVAA
jgi:SLT domain-containing protein